MTITIIREDVGCNPVYAVDPIPTSEREIIDAIVAIYRHEEGRLREAGLRWHTAPARITATSAPTATRAASDVLGPLMVGIFQWLVPADRGESIHRYAQRAARCAAARCAVAGVSVPKAIAHAGAEALGMLEGHINGHHAVPMVSRIERAGE